MIMFLRKKKKPLFPNMSEILEHEMVRILEAYEQCQRVIKFSDALNGEIKVTIGELSELEQQIIDAYIKWRR